MLCVELDSLLIGGVVEHQFIELAASIGLGLEARQQAVAVPLRGLVAVVDG